MGQDDVGELRHTHAMTPITETTAHDHILAERARYVSAGVSTPKLVVSHAVETRNRAAQAAAAAFIRLIRDMVPLLLS